MKQILNQLFNQQTLTRGEAKRILGEISEAKYNHAHISAFLSVFKMRNITVEELTGFRDCLKEKCIKIDLSDFDAIDLCGTGGDGKDTFNISTLASFVVAGAGYKVAKHGNYGVSSICGSSNVMQHLGYQFSNDPDHIKKQIDEVGISFLHAPLFHPAMKEVAPIRKQLGVPTFFNMLGPMVNPSSPKKQLVGVFSLQLQRYYKYIYENEETMSYNIVHSLDGYDEVSLTSQAKISSSSKEYLLSPEEMGFQYLNQNQLRGGQTIKDAAELFVQVLNGEGTEAQNAAVLANAGLAIQCFNPSSSLRECVEEARVSLNSKKALLKFKNLIEI